MKFRSKFEEAVFNRAKANQIKVKYESCKLLYVLVRTYTPDWELPNGVLVETKGKFTAEDRAKMLSVRDCNPDLDIRIVFQNARVPLRKGARSNYGEWATKHGFMWAEKEIPKEWCK